MSPLLLLASAAPAAPATENREASPIALVLVLILLVALIFLIRSMNKHLRKVPASFTKTETETPAEPVEKDPER
jgi:FtsH-binding integral membrane protein